VDDGLEISEVSLVLTFLSKVGFSISSLFLLLVRIRDGDGVFLFLKICIQIKSNLNRLILTGELSLTLQF